MIRYVFNICFLSYWLFTFPLAFGTAKGCGSVRNAVDTPYVGQLHYTTLLAPKINIVNLSYKGKTISGKPISDTGVPMSEFKLPIGQTGSPEIAWVHIKYPESRESEFSLFSGRLHENYRQVSGIYEQYKTQVQNLQLLHPYITFDFATRNLSPEYNYRAHLRTVETEALSEKLGMDVWLEHDFLPPKNARRGDWRSLYMSAFKLRTEKGEIEETIPLSPSSEITYLGFSATSPTKSAKKFIDFAISSSVGFDVSLPNEIETEKLLLINLNSSFAYRERALKIFHGGGVVGGLVLERRSFEYSVPAIKATNELYPMLNKFFRAMTNPEYQRKAKEIIIAGPESIEMNLQKFGWTIRSRPGIKTDPILKGSVSIRDFIERLSARIMPLEEGPFAELHGYYAHHAQLLAGLQGLTTFEVAHVSMYISDYITPSPLNWNLWKLLFDNNGDGIHGNRFWRNLLDEKT